MLERIFNAGCSFLFSTVMVVCCKTLGRKTVPDDLPSVNSTGILYDGEVAENCLLFRKFLFVPGKEMNGLVVAVVTPPNSKSRKCSRELNVTKKPTRPLRGKRKKITEQKNKK